MPNKKIFFSEKAPRPRGPYSQAVIYNGLMYISGQIPIDTVTGLMVRGTIEEETETVLNNLKSIVEEAGAGMADVLKVTCYLDDLEDFARFNSVYEKYFSVTPPARTTFQAGKLPLDVQVEVDAIVALPGKGN
jgi:2-iminobutanoate/2-iminopropanoate deaminase